MMGFKERTFNPIDAVTLEQLVPKDHFYRHLEQSLDLTFTRDLVADCYASGGRPSIDPVVFFKLQLVMFFEDLRSERQLLEIAADRLSVRWYLGYDLGEPLPDHSSLTRIRDRYGLDVFRRFFDVIVKRCQAAGLVWGRELYLDATQVDANAALDSTTPRFVVEDHLDRLFTAEPTDRSHPLAHDVAEVTVRLLPSLVSSELAADLEWSNALRHDWLATAGSPDRTVIRGHYHRLSAFVASRTDPDASPMSHVQGNLHFGYHTHYVVDGGKARVILAALVTPAEVKENLPALDLLWHACFRWHLQPHQVTGDATYGTLENIRAIENAGMRAYLAMRDDDRRSPRFGKQRFRYDAATDVYWCPNGAPLTRFLVRTDERLVRYRADAATCNRCPLKTQCTTSDQGRQIERSFDEEYPNRVRGYMTTEPYQKAQRKRMVWVEPLFAEAKQWHGLDRFRLRRLVKVNSEALLIAAGQNLKRLLGVHGWGRRPWPSDAAGGAIPTGTVVSCVWS